MSHKLERRKGPNLLGAPEAAFMPHCRRIGDFLTNRYFGPRMKIVPSGQKKKVKEFKSSLINESFKAVHQTMSSIEGKERQLSFLTEDINDSLVGPWAEILVLQTTRLCLYLCDLKIAPTQFSQDLQKPGADLKFRPEEPMGARLRFKPKGTKSNLFLVDIYSGNSAKRLSEKTSHLIEQRPRLWFLLPLCIEPQEKLPFGINHILKEFPGFNQKELRNKVALLLLGIAQDGNIPSQLLNPDEPSNQKLAEAIESRLLAGYLIIRSQPGSNLKEISLLEQMVRAKKSK